MEAIEAGGHIEGLARELGALGIAGGVLDLRLASQPFTEQALQPTAYDLQYQPPAANATRSCESNQSTPRKL